MRLPEILAVGSYLVEHCHCQIGVGDPVKVDGMTQRGTVVRRNGRRLVIQYQDWRGGTGYRNGYRIERDQSFVHKI